MCDFITSAVTVPGLEGVDPRPAVTTGTRRFGSRPGIEPEVGITVVRIALLSVSCSCVGWWRTPR